jgi:hypothetical protein
MKKRKTIWVVLGLILVVGVVAWALMPAKEEARYQGKTVKEWFNEIPVTRPAGGTINVGSGVVVKPNAMQVLKKEAIPFLLGELKKTESSTHSWIFSWLNRLSGGRIMSDEDRGLRVFCCFVELGPDARDALPVLIEMARISKTARPLGPTSMATDILINVFPEAAAKAGIK